MCLARAARVTLIKAPSFPQPHRPCTASFKPSSSSIQPRLSSLFVPALLRHVDARARARARHATASRLRRPHSNAMPVQQHVLNWLYSVLTSVCPPLLGCLEAALLLTLGMQEYHDVNRTYSDVARVLNGFPTLTPRTDVHSTVLPRDCQVDSTDVSAFYLGSLFQRHQRAFAACIGHNTRGLPRQYLQVSSVDMGAARVPARASARLRDADPVHGGASGPTRRPPGPSLPSLPREVVRILGRQLCHTPRVLAADGCRAVAKVEKLTVDAVSEVDAPRLSRRPHRCLRQGTPGHLQAGPEADAEHTGGSDAASRTAPASGDGRGLACSPSAHFERASATSLACETLRRWPSDKPRLFAPTCHLSATPDAVTI